MKKKVLSILLCAAMAAAMFAGCGGASDGGDSTSAAKGETSAPAAASGEEDHVIRIGAVCAMTGGSAIYGEGAQNAIDLAVEEINAGDSEYKVEIVNGGKVVDDAKDSKQAVNAYNSLISQSPEAIVGSFFSSVTLPMAELANEQNMLLLATGATNYQVTLIGPTIFRDCFIDPYQGKMAALFAKEQGASKIAIIYAKDDDYSNGLKDAFVENADSNGLEIVYTGECTTTDTDFTAQASQAVAAGADFLFYPCFLDTVPLLVQQARDAGFEGIIMGGDGWDGSDTAGLETYFDNCYFTNHYSSEDTSEAVQNFVSKYTEKYGSESLNACAALYYDAIYMLVQAAENGGGSDTESLVKGMTGMTFTGVGGTFTLDENGDPEKSVAINTYENGQVKWFKTLSPEGK
ncbi:MAG: ABC transporter substrate-binding protein [Lachnospiraceae bacterium]